MRRMLNDRAVTWAMSQTDLNIVDRYVLHAVVMLCPPGEDAIPDRAEHFATVFAMPEHAVISSLDHLTACGYLTEIVLPDNSLGYRINYHATRQQRLESTAVTSYRTYPNWITPETATQ